MLKLCPKPSNCREIYHHKKLKNIFQKGNCAFDKWSLKIKKLWNINLKQFKGISGNKICHSFLKLYEIIKEKKKK